MNLGPAFALAGQLLPALFSLGDFVRKLIDDANASAEEKAAAHAALDKRLGLRVAVVNAENAETQAIAEQLKASKDG